MVGIFHLGKILCSLAFSFFLFPEALKSISELFWLCYRKSNILPFTPLFTTSTFCPICVYKRQGSPVKLKH